MSLLINQVSSLDSVEHVANTKMVTAAKMEKLFIHTQVPTLRRIPTHDIKIFTESLAAFACEAPLLSASSSTTSGDSEAVFTPGLSESDSHADLGYLIGTVIAQPKYGETEPEDAPEPVCVPKATGEHVFPTGPVITMEEYEAAVLANKQYKLPKETGTSLLVDIENMDESDLEPHRSISERLEDAIKTNRKVRAIWRAYIVVASGATITLSIGLAPVAIPIMFGIKGARALRKRLVQPSQKTRLRWVAGAELRSGN